MANGTIDLTGMVAQMKDTEESARNSVKEEMAKQLAKLVPRTVKISVNNWRNPDTGVRHSCVVHSEILNLDDRTRVGRICHSLAGPGTVWVSIPVDIQGDILRVAWLTVSLTDAPSWLSAAIQVDRNLLYAIYEEVERHEAAFFRTDAPSSTDGEEEPRFSVTSEVPTRPA